MGSIQVSLLPKVLIFANPCNDFAMRVNVLRALARGCSEQTEVSWRLMLQVRSQNIPFRRPKSFGFKIAGQKNRRNRKPDTLLNLTDLIQSPYRSCAHD